MLCRISDELALFSRQIDQLRVLYDVEEVAASAFVLHPKDRSHSASGKRIPLSFTGMIHGNETVGVGVFNQLLGYLQRAPWRLPFSLGLALGNLEASLVGKRFLDKDLNRSFGSRDLSCKESQRAQALAPLLMRSQKLIDMHQTIRPNAEPFFIFPYQASSIAFARQVNPSQTIVTHWQDHFSAEGMCADEFVNHHGGVAITVELGEAGFHPYQIAYGFYTALQAINVVAATVTQGPREASAIEAIQPSTTTGLIYTWAHTEPYPRDADVHLREGLNNFMDIAAGEVLGTLSGQPLRAPVAGKILFPKYIAAGTPVHQRPTELFRLIKVISAAELPQQS